jgi:DNA helicase-2/ATP-dependent DNA helicase PcrA
MTDTFTPTANQVAIFDFIQNGSGDGVVSAKAGSGKTKTLRLSAAQLATRRAIFFAFNVHIKDELNAGFATDGIDMRAMTVHGFGFKACGAGGKKLTVFDGKDGKPEKYDMLAKEYVNYTLEWDLRAMLNGAVSEEMRTQAQEVVRQRSRALYKLANMARLTRTMIADRDALFALMAKYDISAGDAASDQIVLNGVGAIIGRGVEMYRQNGIIDFTDMIFIPVALGLPVDKYQWIFVDECQDLSNCARELILKARGFGGRFLFVGDPAQAIMGFAGANAASFRQIIADTNAVVLPLDVCFRCPTSHLDLARYFVPEITNAPNAKVGTVDIIQESAAAKRIGEGALVLCRMTAPLVKTCIKLIGQGKPARVRGRDIGKTLVDLAVTIGSLMDLYGASFGETLNTYETQRTAKLAESENSEERIAMLADQCEALRACYDAADGTTVAAVCSYIDTIFDDKRASIWLSTVHRAKGLEADDVYILYPDMLPLVRNGQTEEDAEQEENIAYVALTRSKDRLTLIRKDEDTTIPFWMDSAA